MLGAITKMKPIINKRKNNFKTRTSDPTSPKSSELF